MLVFVLAMHELAGNSPFARCARARAPPCSPPPNHHRHFHRHHRVCSAGALEAVEAVLKPGVSYLDMQALTYRNILTTLKEAGVVT